VYPIAAAPRVRSHRRAAELLAEHDPVMARLLDQFGPPAPAPPSEPHFANLVRAITAQQLAAAAARTIHGRLLAALDAEATPERVLGLSTDLMRMAGLSLNKIASIRDLAEKVLDGSVTLHPGELAREADEEVITALSSVRGIGGGPLRFSCFTSSVDWMSGRLTTSGCVEVPACCGRFRYRRPRS
jgi:DNA-3-methyladenine glycosylase II